MRFTTMSKEQLLDKKQIITIEPIHDIDAPIERITLTGNVIVNAKKHPFRAEGMHVIFIKKETLLPLHCEIDWLLDQFPTMVYKDKRYYYFE